MASALGPIGADMLDDLVYPVLFNAGGGGLGAWALQMAGCAVVSPQLALVSGTISGLSQTAAEKPRTALLNLIGESDNKVVKLAGRVGAAAGLVVFHIGVLMATATLAGHDITLAGATGLTLLGWGTGALAALATKPATGFVDDRLRALAG